MTPQPPSAGLEAAARVLASRYGGTWQDHAQMARDVLDAYRDAPTSDAEMEWLGTPDHAGSAETGVQLPHAEQRTVDRARTREARRAPGPLFAGRGR